MPSRKPHLPTRICATCSRPFAWRKRWARCWDEIRHCSDACRRQRTRSSHSGDTQSRPGSL
ncbi:MAG: DUF2256 domain-containing protein [Gemmataceae bacterium]